MNSTPEKTPKKPYQTPSLRIYGDVRNLTLAAMKGLGPDNGPGANNKT